MTIFFYGPDSYSLAEEVKKLKAAHPLIEELGFDQKERLQDALGNQGLFAQKKLVILRGFIDEAASLSAAGGNDLSVLFIEESPDRRTKGFKWLVKNAQAREFVAPTGSALTAWINKFVAERGGKIDGAAANELASRVGEANDLRQYANELEKLMLYNPAIEPAAIRALVSRNFNDDVFSITNAFAEGRVGEAAAVLERLDAEPVQIVGALAAQIRSLLLVKSFERQSPAEIAKELGWKDGRVWIMQKLAKNFTAARLRGLLRDLLAIDRRLKTSEEPPKLLLTLFLNKAKA